MKLVSRIAVRVLKPLFNTRYKLASLTRRSKVFGKIIGKLFFEGDDMVVLPKDDVAKRRTVDVGISIDQPNDSTVLPSDVVKAIIDRTDDIFIMNFCLCRESNECKDFPRDRGCVFLGKGIYKIPPEYGHKATKEEAVRYIDECTELGLVHIIGRNKLDSVWLSTGAKKNLMTICNCCPCCCLWNMTRSISDDIGGCFKRMDGAEISMDSSKCIGCGSCRDICFTKAISVEDGKFVIDQKMCRCCGRCAEECPSDAITITYDGAYVDKIVDRIEKLVELSD